MSFTLPLLLLTPANAEVREAEPPAEKFATPAPAESRQHHLSVASDGRLILSWVEPRGDKQQLLRFAVWRAGRWSAPKTVTAASKLPDKPAVVGIGGDNFAAGWLRPVEGRGHPDAVDIFLARSSDDGSTWSRPVKACRDPKAHPYDLFLSALKDGTLTAIWSDGRHVVHRPAVPGKSKESWSGTQMLMATTLDADGRLGPEVPLDKDICSCCMPHSAAVDTEIFTVYRDHQAGEVRDIALVRWSAASGVSELVTVAADGWVIEGCPANGPAVDARASRVAVAWFTGAHGAPQVKLAFSEDGGRRFAAPVVVDAHTPGGFVDVLLMDDGAAVVSWLARRSDGPEQDLRLARVSRAGAVRAQTVVAAGAFADYPSNYPLLQRAGDALFLAWTDMVAQRVRLVTLPTDLGGPPHAAAQASPLIPSILD